MREQGLGAVTKKKRIKSFKGQEDVDRLDRLGFGVIRHIKEDHLTHLFVL